MSLLQIMKERYSVRSYKDQKIEQETLEAILEAGRVAPTAANRQTQRILVINTEEGLDKVAKGAKIYDPPAVLVICSLKEESWVNPFDGTDMNHTDCSIVTTHMMLEAQARGVNSLWINWYDPVVIREELNIPKEYHIINLLVLGYSSKEALDPERHKTSRKPLSETVFYGSFSKE